ncbi:hypothetical protein Leryth_018082 [Lithospermum erythrorhizon]|nr:hypothetical protein Leryth_018082 [Lithospermum erythrorhizon]
MTKEAIDMPQKGGFSFDLCKRNDMLLKNGLKMPSFLKTGTTIVGLIFQDGVILGADTRATEGPISHLFNYQGHVSAALVLGGVDVTGPHLHTIYPHGSTDTLPYATMGSGSLAAMAIFESKYREGLSREEGVALVAEAIRSGIFNDLGSGSNVDICVITKGQKEYLRNHMTPNPRTYVSEKGYSFSKKTELLSTKITPLRETVVVIEGGDAMEE